MPNRLAASRSPYLLQHAHQPVDWQEWGPEAFEQARKENKPIFLSAGYSTCHWCHVMARESFDDPAVADVLNTLFVNVKLDREERPDVDRLYMAFVQATTGHGGWPMSVWLTPDLKPFYGGTYFPPRPGHGRPSFLDVVRALASAWAGDRERLVRNAGEIADALAQAAVGGSALSPAIEPPSHDEIVASIERFHDYFDEENGGFGGAPKFPRPAILLGLSRAAHRAAAGSPARRTAERMLTGTLHALCAGGIRDHLGGGFHRYSVDARWHVPHFEKMLYDQGQIASALADGILQLGLDDLRPALRELCGYVARDLTHPDGGCHAAEDADSAEPGAEAGHGHGREGAFYTWSADEARAALGPELYPVFEYAYGLNPHGNVPEQHDPHREMDGLNVLERPHGDAAVAQRFGIAEDRAAHLLSEARSRLLAARAARPRPHLDDKILSGWNGLMLSGLSRAARALGEPGPARQAARLAEFLRTHLVDPASGRLHRTWRGTLSPVPAFAEDHAALALGLLDLYETTFDWKHLAWALELQEQLIAGFEDAEHGGFFGTRAGADDLLLRMKEDHDGAEPSASSLAALALARTAAMLELPRLRESAARTVRAFAHRWRVEPFSMPGMLAAADFLAGPVTQVVVSGDPRDPATRTLLEALQGRFLPRSVIVLDDRGAGREWLARHLPAIGAGPLSGPPTAHVCREGACSAPVSEPEQLLELLADA